MNARLKALAQRPGGMGEKKAQDLLNLYDGDEAFVETLLMRSKATEERADGLHIAYKAAQPAAAPDRGLSLDAYTRQRFDKMVADAEAALIAEYRAYKAGTDTAAADAAPLDDGGGDEYPPELLDALEAAYAQLEDWAPITMALQQLAAPPVKGRVLTDSGDQSVLPATKAAPAWSIADAFRGPLTSDMTPR